MFNTYNHSLTEGEEPVVQPTFNTIVELLKMRDESKYGFSTYYIKFWHVKTVFDEFLDRIGELELKNSSPTNIVFNIRTPKE